MAMPARMEFTIFSLYSFRSTRLAQRVVHGGAVWRQLAGHVVEPAEEPADLVPASDLHLRVQRPVADARSMAAEQLARWVVMLRERKRLRMIVSRAAAKETSRMARSRRSSFWS